MTDTPAVAGFWHRAASAAGVDPGVPAPDAWNFADVIRPFDEVDAAFAAAEGEDDLSLEAWRNGHAAYFARVLARRGLPIEHLGDLPIVLERFDLLYSEPRRASTGA